MKNRIIDVLGTKYVIIVGNRKDFDNLKELDGYCDLTEKTIVIDDFKDTEGLQMENVQVAQDKVLRHEVIHAFLYESGISSATDFTEEQLVEWMAIQMPKIAVELNKLGILPNDYIGEDK